MRESFKIIKGGGVCSPLGFLASGVHCGIKKNGHPDLALVLSERYAEVAAAFTTNQVKAAPVKVSMTKVKNHMVRGVVINSGNANACTGLKGLEDAQQMVRWAAEACDAEEKDFLVCSTGRIGVALPMKKVAFGIKKAAKALSKSNGKRAAEAIMTSDTFPKEIAVSMYLGEHKITIGGMAKGAGMIHPNMATMLACITTDVKIERQLLRRVVADAVEKTFNRISVDGDTSTNDTVVVLANGAAENPILRAFHPQFKLFERALLFVMRSLAQMIVADGEGITKVVHLTVKGARNAQDAKRAAHAVARSMLVKTSWCGEDVNWGRLMDALGYSEAKVREELVEIFYNGHLVVQNGVRSRVPDAKIKNVVKQKSFSINIDLHLGTGEYSLTTTDLTEEYVRLNKGE
ncbi:MAG: bifunctional glutamate N-acetyltransferase/amino-acid acetyltransferase ArgJ [Methylacidiphilales bacterium]|nr:bifunctional glutamate N-acetyltransferase/amino-acid acetyltransferase ArgJ [Candidatus Methylacidiphilales bacterium]